MRPDEVQKSYDGTPGAQQDAVSRARFDLQVPRHMKGPGMKGGQPAARNPANGQFAKTGGSGKAAGLVIVAVVAMVCVTAFLLRPIPGSQAGVFSVSYTVDGHAIDTQYVHADLYRKEIGKVAYVEATGITTLDQITNAMLDPTKYASCYVNLSCTTIPQTQFDDEEGPRACYAVEYLIRADQANDFEGYVTLGAVNVILANLETFAQVNASSIIAPTNITALIRGNGSQAYDNARYVSFFSYTLNSDIKPMLVITYNKTVTASTAFVFAGCGMVSINSTAYGYTFDSITTSTLSLDGRWSTASTYNVTHCYLSYNGVKLATSA